MTRMARLLSALLFVSAFSPVAFAQSQPQPEPAPMPPPIATPVDKPYPGPVQLSVDITDLTDRAWKVHEEIPVVPGAKEMVLLYPQWLPGEHAPGGPIASVAGIVTQVDGQKVQWVRDAVNMYAFHVPF